MGTSVTGRPVHGSRESRTFGSGSLGRCRRRAAIPQAIAGGFCGSGGFSRAAGDGDGDWFCALRPNGQGFAQPSGGQIRGRRNPLCTLRGGHCLEAGNARRSHSSPPSAQTRTSTATSTHTKTRAPQHQPEGKTLRRPRSGISPTRCRNPTRRRTRVLQRSIDCRRSRPVRGHHHLDHPRRTQTQKLIPGASQPSAAAPHPPTHS